MAAVWLHTCVAPVSEPRTKPINNAVASQISQRAIKRIDGYFPLSWGVVCVVVVLLGCLKRQRPIRGSRKLWQPRARQSALFLTFGDGGTASPMEWKTCSICLTLTRLWFGVEMFMRNILSVKLLSSGLVERRKKKSGLFIWAQLIVMADTRHVAASFILPFHATEQHPEEKSRLFFPDRSAMTAGKVQPIGARSSPAAPSHVIFLLIGSKR